jgi:hypothetical protein
MPMCESKSETKLPYFIPCKKHNLMLYSDTHLNKFVDYVESKEWYSDAPVLFTWLNFISF